MTDYSALSDEELVVFCKKQEQAAWDALVRRYFADATFLASQFTNTPMEAEDLVSEGLIGFYSAVFTFESTGKFTFRTYANTCMKNRMINAVRSTGSQKQIPFFQCVPLEDQTQMADSHLSPEERMIAKTEAAKLEHLITSMLTKNERTVFMLFALGDSYGEISRKTGLSVKAVDGTLQRARKKLRGQLSKYAL